jgi:ribosomal protein S12 methylthiotransferase
MPAASHDHTVHFVSLGCPKNRVDTECMLGSLRVARYQHVDDPRDADVIVVNTCAFLRSSIEESLATVLEHAAYKEEGRCKKLVVAGCLTQRYPGELAQMLPEVDHFLGTSEYTKIAEVLADGAGRELVSEPRFVHDAETPKVVSTAPRGYAYLKVAEGCSRRCSFCIIPKLRGLQQISRPLDDVVAEARQLAAAGIHELNLVAQDLTAYGRDLAGAGRGGGGGDLAGAAAGDGNGRRAARLTELLRAVAAVPGIRWTRCLYAYPENFPEELIHTLRDTPGVARYLDMPLQHVSDPVLRAMRRGHGGDRVRKLVERIRTLAPEVTLRTTFIVGFPGETDADFRQLCDFVREMQFDRVGVFRYSREEGTEAHDLAAQVPARVKNARFRELMKLQKQISRERWKAWVGRECDALVEGPSDDHAYVYAARLESQAPEVDGVVYLTDAGAARPGQMARVRITRAGDYDLVGEVVGPSTQRLKASTTVSA